LILFYDLKKYLIFTAMNIAKKSYFIG